MRDELGSSAGSVATAALLQIVECSATESWPRRPTSGGREGAVSVTADQHRDLMTPNLWRRLCVAGLCGSLVNPHAAASSGPRGSVIAHLGCPAIGPGAR